MQYQKSHCNTCQSSLQNMLLALHTLTLAADWVARSGLPARY